MKILVLLLLLTIPAGAETMADFAFRQTPGAALPLDASLLDEAGRPTTLRAVAGGLPLVLALGYLHCPNLCGVVRDDTLSALSRSALRPGRDYALAVVTIDPAETPSQAQAARTDGLARYPVDGAEAGWRYLTGPEPSLRAVQDAVGFRARFDAAAKQFLHPAGLVLATPAGSVAGYVLGVGYTPADLEAAVARARAGVSLRASPILLLCFHFDETTGRYTLAVMKVVRLAAFVTAVGIGVALWRAHRTRIA